MFESFTARTSIRSGTAVIQLAGPLDGRADTALDDAMDEALRGEPAAILLSFADLGYMNSTGIALVVGLLARARKQSVAVLATGLSDHYRHIFEITRLSDFVQFFPDEEAALLGRQPA